MKVLPIFVCSGLNTWNVQTSCTVFTALSILNRQPYVIGSGGGGGGGGRGRGGVAIARTTLINGAREWMKGSPGAKAIRGLWLDDDIECMTNPGDPVDQAQKLAESIEEADRHNWNFVAPYRVNDPVMGKLKWCLFHWGTNEPFTDEEVNGLKDFDVVDGFAGLGFYYGYTPLGYHFSMGGPDDEGEDCRFFRDNKIELRAVHLRLKHFKGSWV